jgi:hypothetical protein
MPWVWSGAHPVLGFDSEDRVMNDGLLILEAAGCFCNCYPDCVC